MLGSISGTVSAEHGRHRLRQWRTARPSARRSSAGIAALAALPCALLLAACGSSTAPTTGTTSGTSNATLNAATPQGPNSFDPCANGGGASIPFLDLLYVPIIYAVPSTNQLVPGLASSWNFTGAGNLTFVVHLKPGYKFQDGTPVTAQAAMQSINYCLAEKVQTLPTLKNMTVTGPDTLQFNLTAPTASLPAELSQQLGMLISPAAIKKYGVKSLGAHPVGAGPFTLASYVPNSSVAFTRWAGYKPAGAPAPKVGKINVQIVTDQTSLASALTSGTVDYAFAVDPSVVPALKGDSSLHVHINTGALAVTAMFINYNVPPMNNVDVRLALEYALNRPALSKAASDNVVDEPAYSVYAPGSPFYDTSMTNAWPYDPAKAKQLLAAAGYPHGITINGALSIAAPPFEQDAIIAAGQWKQAGINVNFSEDQPTQALQQFALPKGGPMFSVGWDGTVTPLATYYGLFSQASFANPGHVANATIQSDLAKLNSTYTTSGVLALEQNMDSVIKSQALMIPLWFNPFPEVYSSHVSGALQASSLINEPDLDYLSVTS
jgi:peptide/nickel transport system substrate-binding protein